MTFLIYQNILCNNINSITINHSSSNSNSSLSSRLELPSSQSIASQLGFKTENSINEYINTHSGISNLKQMYPKIGKHQVDVLFKFHNTIYYFESKNNLNLDTEKTIRSNEKIKNIKKYLTKEFSSYRVVCKYLNMWIYGSNNLIFKSGRMNKKDIYGYSDFFNIFGVKVTKNEFSKLQKRVKKQIHCINFEDINESDNNSVNRYKYLSLQRKYDLLEQKNN